MTVHFFHSALVSFLSLPRLLPRRGPKTQRWHTWKKSRMRTEVASGLRHHHTAAALRLRMLQTTNLMSPRGPAGRTTSNYSAAPATLSQHLPGRDSRCLKPSGSMLRIRLYECPTTYQYCYHTTYLARSTHHSYSTLLQSRRRSNHRSSSRWRTPL
jgi:hypothetical protein